MGGIYHADSRRESGGVSFLLILPYFKWLVENRSDVPGDLLRSHMYRKRRYCHVDEKVSEQKGFKVTV